MKEANKIQRCQHLQIIIAKKKNVRIYYYICPDM